jgi:hypothetical protein
MTGLRRIAEIALIFGVFFAQGAYPVPDVNEPNYLGKAIHYWNPGWAAGDFFLNTRDIHQVFYFTFGWLSLWLTPTALAWTGRIMTWGLLAWAWRRLSFAVLPRRWISVLTAALLVCLIDRCNMAGEWIIGGVEAKSFAYVFVFLGLEAVARDRWNRAWLLLGAASAFHVVVGGWAAVTVGLAWLGTRKRGSALVLCQPWSDGLGATASLPSSAGNMVGQANRGTHQSTTDRALGRQLISMWPGLAGGLLLSLPGLVPIIVSTWGVDAEVVRQADLIYVYHRLYHHLSPLQIPLLLATRFVLLCLMWLLVAELTPREKPLCFLRAFLLATLAIALCGLGIGLLEYSGCLDRGFSAKLLRFYWFRLADIAIPMGAALMGASAAMAALQNRPAAGKRWLVILIALAGLHVGFMSVEHLTTEVARADRMPHYTAWRDICNWVAKSPDIPPGSLFLTPRMAETFKWYAGRGEVATWKEFPQDPVGIVDWWQRLRRFHGSLDPNHPWFESLTEVPLERLLKWAEYYKVDYILTEADPPLPLPEVYKNEAYVIYGLRSEFK